MTTGTIYICDSCGETFDDETACSEHEAMHYHISTYEEEYVKGNQRATFGYPDRLIVKSDDTCRTAKYKFDGIVYE